MKSIEKSHSRHCLSFNKERITRSKKKNLYIVWVGSRAPSVAFSFVCENTSLVLLIKMKVCSVALVVKILTLSLPTVGIDLKVHTHLAEEKPSDRFCLFNAAIFYERYLSSSFLLMSREECINNNDSWDNIESSTYSKV